MSISDWGSRVLELQFLGCGSSSSSGAGTIVCCTSNYSLSSQRLQFVFRRGIRALCHQVGMSNLECQMSNRRAQPILTSLTFVTTRPFESKLSWRSLLQKFNFQFLIFNFLPLLTLQRYDIPIAVSRMIWQLFFKKVLKSLTFLFLDFTLLRCCSVAVLLRVLSFPKNISIFIYINIELNIGFRRIYFGTATLQQVQQFLMSKGSGRRKRLAGKRKWPAGGSGWQKEGGRHKACKQQFGSSLWPRM